VGDVLAVKDRVHFYTSPDLKAWAFASEFGAEQGAHGGVWECPDLFELPLAGGGSRWVLLLSINPGAPNGGSGTQYFIGQFDGQRFRPDPGFDGPEARWLDYGRDNYAGVTWSDVPASDGRRLFIGWMSNWAYAQAVPTQRWRSAMTLPRSLRLASLPGGLRLASLPVREAEALRGEPFNVAPHRIEGEEVLPLAGPLLELDFEWEPAEGESPSEWGLRFFNAQGEELRVGYKSSDSQYFIDRSKAGRADFSDDFAGLHPAPREAASARQPLRLWLDVASVELFADSGLTAMTDIFFPSAVLDRVALYSRGGAMQVKGRAWELVPLSAD
jgi:fructan beta-fructosidase